MPSSCPSSTKLNVVPCTSMSFPNFVFVIFMSNFLAILIPTFPASVCVYSFPFSVSNAKYTACVLYVTSLYFNTVGNCILYVNLYSLFTGSL